MSPYWAAQRHEDKHAKGIPDVSYSMSGINGWIELKTVRAMEGGLVDLSHFTSEQKQWLKRHGRRGGHCFLFIEITNKSIREYIMIDWRNVDIGGKMLISELIKLSCYHSSESIDLGGFINALL